MSAGIRRPALVWKCLPSGFLISNPAKNSRISSIKRKQRNSRTWFRHPLADPAFRIPARRWIISGALGGTNTSVPPNPQSACIFCEKSKEDQDEQNLILHRGAHNFILLNLFPYTSGHLMIAPYAHVATLEEAEENVVTEMMLLTRLAQKNLRDGLPGARDSISA